MIQEVELNSEVEISISCLKSEMGDMPLIDLIALLSLVRQEKAEFVFEFGTWRGRTTLNLAKNIKKTGKVYTLDIPLEKQPALSLAPEDYSYFKWSQKKLYQGTKEEQKIVEILEDSFLFNPEEFKEFFDLVFIDGSHSYEYVKNDTQKGLYMLKRKGVICWHDYEVCGGVTKYLEELSNFLEVYCFSGTSLCYYRKN